MLFFCQKVGYAGLALCGHVIFDLYTPNIHGLPGRKIT